MMAEPSPVEVVTGQDASEELVAFLERFFDEINDEAAQAYDYHAARLDGELAGVAATKDCGDYTKLAFLHVDDAHQRSGVASTLVEAVCDATANDEMLAKAHVGWRKANRFYERTGWERDDTRSSGMLTAYVREC